MRICDRSIGRMLGAPFELRHYRVLGSMFAASDGVGSFADTLRRYGFAAGRYPHTVRLRTPTGVVAPTLYSYHDMLTVNEVFFRHDYRSDGAEVVVDIGANIGLSALYFLTRNTTCRCTLFEPVPENVRKLKQTLSGFESRYELKEVAVAPSAGMCEFGVEPTGRYGGLGRETGRKISVQCVDMNGVLGEVLAESGRIDVLKIDTEGSERALVDAILPSHRNRIGRIFFESNDGCVVQMKSTA
jgi:FkbM family methyltransferase